MRFLALSVFALVIAACSQAIAEGEVQNISPSIAAQMVQSGQIVLVDVRTPEEWSKTGIAVGAVPLTLNDTDFTARAKALVADGDRQLAFICRTGSRSSSAANMLANVGINAINVEEGMVGKSRGEGWLERGLPVSAWQDAHGVSR